MNNDKEVSTDLASKASIVKACLAAIVIAAIALVFIVLPAEYDIDPSGIGEAMGLTKLAQPADVDTLVIENINEEVGAGELSQDNITVTVPANKGIEFKFNMKKHESMEYDWLSDSGALYFDLHGEPEGDTSGYFLSYAIATAETMKGSFIAPFTGAHGWYWKNTSDKPVSIQLMAKGRYTIKK